MPKQYTILDGDRRYKQIEWGAAPLPHCQADFLDTTITCHEPGEFDSPTTLGPWADLCRKHAATLSPKGCSIGFHRVKKG